MTDTFRLVRRPHLVNSTPQGVQERFAAITWCFLPDLGHFQKMHVHDRLHLGLTLLFAEVMRS